MELATRFNGEVINADAMQTYRGLPITTNQIRPEEMNGIRHHLISINNLDEEAWHVVRFQRECLKVIQEIRRRGNLPILVGGTHYYVQAVLFNNESLSEVEEPEEKHEILEASPQEMLEKLRQVDPVMAARWHPNESRKIRRSLQIYLQTGRRASDVYQEQKIRQQNVVNDESQAVGKLRFRTLIFWLDAARDVLNERLVKRVDKMEEQGLISEAETMFNYITKMSAEGIQVDRTKGVWVSIGFKELEPLIQAMAAKDSGSKLENLKQECFESVKSSTKKYAKSQLRWIRGKLFRALIAANATSHFYPIDTSDPSNWDRDVLGPSEGISDLFLREKPLLAPSDISDFAREALNKHSRDAAEDSKPLTSETCDICKVTTLSGQQWQIHLQSPRHKNAISFATRKARLISENPYYREAQKKSVRNIVD